jgi:hypothetical protein
MGKEITSAQKRSLAKCKWLINIKINQLNWAMPLLVKKEGATLARCKTYNAYCIITPSATAICLATRSPSIAALTIPPA